MEPRSVLGCVCYLRARSVAAFSVDSHELLDVKTNDFSLVEHGVSTSAEATPPLYEIVCRLLGCNSRVCGGYEVASFLLSFPHPHCLLACSLNF